MNNVTTENNNLKNEDIKLKYLNSVKERNDLLAYTLENILTLIKSDCHADTVARIRKTKDIEVKKELKHTLPAFHPNLSFIEGDTKSTIRPSGIIGFDLDLKDQIDDFDILGLKNEIITKIPSCIYAYVSPSGGLKFGIKTDFLNQVDGDFTKERFKIAYNLTLKYLIGNVSTHFETDDTSFSIMLTSFFSHDPDAYINLDCENYLINDECIYEPFDDWNPIESNHSTEYILELLQYIPALPFAERLPINFAVFKCLGIQGESILIEHWVNRGKSRSKITEQVKSQAKNVKFGSIGHLINVAKEYGYTKLTTGRARNNLKPKRTEVQLDPLLSVDAGKAKLQEIVKDFFNQNNNVFVNISAGAGKSTEVLNVLAKEIPYNKKILYLVPTHSLAEELEGKFKIARNRPDLDQLEEKHIKQDKELISLQRRLKTFKSPISNVVHLYGKKKLCENDFAKEAFNGAGNIPVKFCSTCTYSTGCRYIEQFQNTLDNIRIMTHREWSGSQSAWFGVKWFPTTVQPEGRIKLCHG